ncbi:hypothetical protein K6V06_14795 [Cupriavidus sp. AU9028]|nr:hypothetical protein [Cupriavidus sp. AU9028]
MLGTFVVGLAVGAASRALHPAGRVPSLAMALLLGGVGALGGFYLGRAFGVFTDGKMMGWVASILCAALLAGVGGIVGRVRAGR